MSYAPDFDRVLKGLQSDTGAIDLSLASDYQVSFSIAESLTKDGRTAKGSATQFTDAYLQSKVVRIAKMEKQLTLADLSKHLKSSFNLQLDRSALQEVLQKLSDMQYISIDSDQIKYIP